MKKGGAAWTPWFWVGTPYSFCHLTCSFFTLADCYHLLKWGVYSLRKEVTWMKITLYYCGETFDLEGGEAKALVKQLDNQEYPGLVTVKTSSGELTVNLTETTSFALHRRRSMRIM